MQTFVIPGLKFDAGELQTIIQTTTGKTETVSVDGTTVTIAPDLSPAELSACNTAIQAAPAPVHTNRPDAILVAAKTLAGQVNGKDVTTLTAADVVKLVELLCANEGWINYNGTTYTINVH